MTNICETVERHELPKPNHAKLINGEVAEWPKAPLSKSGSALKVLVGSNPTLSANETCSRLRLSRGVSLGSSQVSFGLRSDRSPLLRRGAARLFFLPLFHSLARLAQERSARLFSV